MSKVKKYGIGVVTIVTIEVEGVTDGRVYVDMPLPFKTDYGTSGVSNYGMKD